MRLFSVCPTRYSIDYSCAACRRVTHTLRTEVYDHVTSLLRDLHWLRVAKRIAYRLAVLAFHCQHCLHHRTSLMNSVQLQMMILEGGFDQLTRRRLSCRERSTRRLVTARFRSRRHASGTVCHLSSRRLHHCQFFKRRLKAELFTRSYRAA